MDSSRAPPACFEVVLQAGGERFAARADQTLLAAALDAGVDIPSSCRTGTCRTCMRRLLAGEVACVVEWPGLSPDEKAEGWILPCVACARSHLLLGEAAQLPWWVTG